MAYETSNPPKKISGGIGGGEAVWIYVDGDARATIEGADYFSNGDALGMNVNDVVIVVDTTTPSTTVNRVSAVTAGGAASLSAATLA